MNYSFHPEAEVEFNQAIVTTRIALRDWDTTSQLRYIQQSSESLLIPKPG